ncbi:MAG: hypothetical protein QMD13_02360 [Candidatus Bathyarchaeia archaeon]|nr:hypothetical protein [Candidatus Bathyarchaeia archaeon]
MGVKGAWEKARNSIVELTKASIDTGLISVVMNFNINEIDDIIDFALSRGVQRIWINEVVPFGRAYLNRELIIPQQSVRDEIKVHLQDKYKDDIKKKRLYIDIGILEDLKDRVEHVQPMFVIKPNSQVRVSDGLPLIVGNLLKDDPHILWNKVNTSARDPLIKTFVNQLANANDLPKIKNLCSHFTIDERVIKYI